MRWKVPKSGDTKIKKKFAWFPIWTEDEIIWLEWVMVKYVYYNCGYGFDRCKGWEMTGIIEDEKSIIDEFISSGNWRKV